MKTIERVVTYDGKEHRSPEYAARYLDFQFGEIVTALAHKFAPAGVKYSQFAELIESNLPEFEKLLRIKADWKMED